MYFKVFNGLGNYFVKRANARQAGHPTTDLLYNAIGQKLLHWGDSWKAGREQLKVNYLSTSLPQIFFMYFFTLLVD